MCLGIILASQDGRFIDIKNVSYDYLIIYALAKVRVEKREPQASHREAWPT